MAAASLLLYQIIVLIIAATHWIQALSLVLAKMNRCTSSYCGDSYAWWSYNLLALFNLCEATVERDFRKGCRFLKLVHVIPTHYSLDDICSFLRYLNKILATALGFSLSMDDVPFVRDIGSMMMDSTQTTCMTKEMKVPETNSKVNCHCWTKIRSVIGFQYHLLEVSMMFELWLLIWWKSSWEGVYDNE